MTDHWSVTDQMRSIYWSGCWWSLIDLRHLIDRVSITDHRSITKIDKILTFDAPVRFFSKTSALRTSLATRLYNGSTPVSKNGKQGYAVGLWKNEISGQRRLKKKRKRLGWFWWSRDRWSVKVWVWIGSPTWGNWWINYRSHHRSISIDQAWSLWSTVSIRSDRTDQLRLWSENR